VRGGMQGVADRLAVGLDVRLAHPVRAIEQQGAHVSVRHDHGSVRGRRVVVAVPPKLAATLAFDPPVPRTALVERMPMGAVIKHTAIYERPFWRDDGLSGLAVGDAGPIRVVFDNSPPEGAPGVLMGFSEADSARELGRLTTTERRAVASRCFARFF